MRPSDRVSRKTWLSLCSFNYHTVRDGFVSPLGSQLHVFAAAGELDLYAAITAIVTIIGRLVSNQVLRTQFPRDFGERALQREHIAREKCYAAGFVAEPYQPLV